MDLEICIGRDTDGNRRTLDLEHLPHLLVGGATGQGKTLLLTHVLKQLVRQNTPSELSVAILDLKAIEYVDYADLPHLIAPISTSGPECVATLRMVNRELDLRLDHLCERFPPLIVVVDDVDILLEEARDEALPLLTRIAALSRPVNIHVMVAVWDPSSQNLPWSLRASFSGRIAFKVADAHDSKMLVETSEAEKLCRAGDFIARIPGAQFRGNLMSEFSPCGS